MTDTPRKLTDLPTHEQVLAEQMKDLEFRDVWDEINSRTLKPTVGQYVVSGTVNWTRTEPSGKQVIAWNRLWGKLLAEEPEEAD